MNDTAPSAHLPDDVDPRMWFETDAYEGRHFLGERRLQVPGTFERPLGRDHELAPAAVPGTSAAPSPVRARFRSTFDQRRASPGVRGSGTKPSRR